MQSTLILAGAGPGDADLITVKALKAIASADVILYDALANEALLQHASAECIKHFAGKRMGCHYLSQDEINHLIVHYGSRFKRVMRLKGGDPFVFGRAQEEIEAARSAGMTIEVIPGISSCVAAPASQLIPLTCRGLNESFWVTTGTTRTGEISPDIKLAALTSATVVLLMAMSKLEMIMEIFCNAGKRNTPVAIIEHATTVRQRAFTGTVGDIYFKAIHHKLCNPSVIIIGEVVNQGIHNAVSIATNVAEVEGLAQMV